MSVSSGPIILSDESSNDSHSNSNAQNQVPTKPPSTKNIAVKRGIAVKSSSSSSQQQPSAAANAGPKYKRDLISSNFLDDFNPLTSRREKNKRKNFKGPKPMRAKGNYFQIYDENGRLKSSNQDVCDCFDLTCPGCHFPCFACGSNKCGTKCRNNRRFMYEVIEYDGKDIQLTNPLFST